MLRSRKECGTGHFCPPPRHGHKAAFPLRHWRGHALWWYGGSELGANVAKVNGGSGLRLFLAQLPLLKLVDHPPLEVVAGLDLRRRLRAWERLHLNAYLFATYVG